MNDWMFGGVAAASVFAGGVLGLQLYRLLPDHHLTDESRDVVRLGIGMISILASLVLGFLLASAKSTYDANNDRVRTFAAGMIQIDGILRAYGPETNDARDLLRNYTADVVQNTWRPRTDTPLMFSHSSNGNLERAAQLVLNLRPTDAVHEELRREALDVGRAMINTRLTMLVSTEGSANHLMIGIMIVWVALVFASFGLNAPRNATVVTSFFVCALSIGALIFLILEMDSPFDGMIQVSPLPMREALSYQSG